MILQKNIPIGQFNKNQDEAESCYISYTGQVSCLSGVAL